jgi:hypothetical protein
MAACLAGVLADGRRAQGVGGALCLPPPEVVSQSHRDALEVLLRAKACRLRKTQPRGRGYRDCVEVLVRAKADLDKAQPHGMAAVRIVAQGGGHRGQSSRWWLFAPKQTWTRPRTAPTPAFATAQKRLHDVVEVMVRIKAGVDKAAQYATRPPR